MYPYLGEERSDENEEDVIRKQEAQKNDTDLWDYGKINTDPIKLRKRYIVTV